MKQVALALALMPGIAAVPATAAVNVDAYVKKDSFNQIKISPDGKYYAASVPLADRTMLVVLERATNKITGSFKLPVNNHVATFRWVNNDRVVISVAEKFGQLDMPQPTGELFAIGADGSKPEMLVGYRVNDGGLSTTIKPKKDNAKIWGYLVDSLPADERSVLISAQPYSSSDPYSSAEKLDTYTGRLTRVAKAPVRAASFQADNHGVVRFVTGSNSDNARRLYYRTGNGAEWELLNVESETRGAEVPIGFSADDKIAYLLVEQKEGPDALVALDLETRKRTEVLRDDDVDPAGVIYRNGTRVPVGLHFMDGKPRTAFLDEKSPEARLHHGLEAAFAGSAVEITSQTADGGLALVKVSSDRNPGDFYLFDTAAKKAAHVIASRDWLDPEEQAPVQPVKLAARDGLALHGYLTTPKGSSGKGLPLVVMPHGGPYGVQDVWGFDDDAQVLAAAGYAVLQLNYRGSSGYGRAFLQAGGREWGGKMQDDLTDATRWAIAQGIADKSRICLYGASYGGYASLMGVAKEPSLYACAVGYVGVYDLPKRVNDYTRDSARDGNWSKDWIGNGADLSAVSPNRLADRIKVPVFLAAGGEDERFEHSKMMEAALRKAGVPVETLYYDTEGHGFYKPEHQKEFYTRLLAFLSRSLGGGVAMTPASGSNTGK
ncbi:alpha/beta hydrolase family protein [Lysobacter niabensis]|uniref:alpha/beta hydrolase family protein n=1 Tax=Agrilutibacter niabensis TaxID=380628 RepID=UPI00360E4969